jgi:hypothetical protein
MVRWATSHGKSMSHLDPSEVFRGSQLELFDGEPAPAWSPDLDRMREILHGLLAEARGADSMPWPPPTARFYRQFFPQLSFCLPEEEGAQLRQEFAAVLARLEAALIAPEETP